MATSSLGFEAEGYSQELKARELYNETFYCDEDVEHISITNIEDEIVTPTRAVSLHGKFFMFNPDTQAMEEEDIVDEGIEIIQADTGHIIRIEKNTYIKKYKFDCSKVEDEESSPYQPISGLTLNEGYLTLKSDNFTSSKDCPCSGDLLFYKNNFWIIEETRKKSVYLPREKTTLYLSIKQTKK